MPRKTTFNLLVWVHWLGFPVSAFAAVDAAVVEDSPAWSNLQSTHTNTYINIFTVAAVMQQQGGAEQATELRTD